LELNQGNPSTFWAVKDLGILEICFFVSLLIDCIFNHRCPSVSKITWYFCHPNGEKNWVSHSVHSGYTDWIRLALLYPPEEDAFVCIRSGICHLASLHSLVPGS
jgi:hypothetical protein